MKRFWLALAGALIFANAAHAAIATCGSGTTSISSGSTELFGHSFTSAQSFSDCYSFTLPTNKPGNVFGGTLKVDPLSFLDIEISSIALGGGGLLTTLIDTTPGLFSFSGLLGEPISCSSVATSRMVVVGTTYCRFRSAMLEP